MPLLTPEEHYQLYLAHQRWKYNHRKKKREQKTEQEITAYFDELLKKSPPHPWKHLEKELE